MCGAMLVMAIAATGVDAGWQRLPDGGMEYIIQLEPHALESFEAGKEIICDIPPDLTEIRSYRLRVGSAPLPREEPPPKEEPPNSVAPAAEKAPGPIDLSPWPSEPSFGPSAAEASDSLRDTPLPLQPASSASPMPEQQAVYTEPGPSAGRPEPPSETSEQADARPWLPFTLALAGCFGALGGMLYTGWIAWDYRRRYEVLLQKTLDRHGLSVANIDASESMTG